MICTAFWIMFCVYFTPFDRQIKETTRESQSVQGMNTTKYNKNTQWHILENNFFSSSWKLINSLQHPSLLFFFFFSLLPSVPILSLKYFLRFFSALRVCAFVCRFPSDALFPIIELVFAVRACQMEFEWNIALNSIIVRRHNIDSTLCMCLSHSLCESFSLNIFTMPYATPPNTQHNWIQK